ncbi:dihydroxyacetone kinase phosphoryl donor subunit DhaM [Aerococcus urinaeequi]
MTNLLILVSHSQTITEGLKELLETMVPDDNNTFSVISAGGTDDGEIGTSVSKITDAIFANSDKEIFIFTDMGSAVLSAETALDFVEDDLKTHVHLVEGPLVEGAYIGAVQSTINRTPEQILVAIKEQS